MLTMMRFGGVFLMAAALAAPQADGAAKQAPNVVIILSDDQGWTDFGFMGHPSIETPHLDRLASQSLVYTRGYVPSSLCRPSLASLVTGLYAHQHKITSNDPPKELPAAEFARQRQQQIAHIDQVATLPRLLGQQGYVSLQTGKWWEGNPARAGFTDSMTHGDTTRGGRHGDQGLAIGRQGMQPVFDFIDAAEGRPFFVWYAPMMPHQPHTPPQRLLDKYIKKTDSRQIAQYWAMCEWFDETCGELLGHLDRRGLADNTMVIFLVDNGWIQLPNAPGSDPRSKQSPYDGGLRTPIMIRWPQHAAPRRDEQSLAISIDLAPTILAACGLQQTPNMQGINLLDPSRVAARKAIFGEVFEHNAVDIHQPQSSLRFRWMIENNMKLIVPNPAREAAGSVELYDVLADPHERRDLSAARPDAVARLRGLMDQWWSAR